MLERSTDDDFLLRTYRSVLDKLAIKEPPIISWSADLEKIGLHGLYNNNRKAITVSTVLEDQSDLLIITIVHELSHFLLYDENYKEGAHGWPFLALCALLSYKLDLEYHYILNDNITNWRKNVSVGKWYRHFFVARGLIRKELDSGDWTTLSAHDLAKKIVKHNMPPTSIFPRWVNFKTHKYFARTDGDIFLLRDFSVAALILAFSFAEMKLPNPFLVSLLFGVAYISIYEYMVKYNSRYRLFLYWVRQVKVKFLHPVLLKLPWNIR